MPGSSWRSTSRRRMPLGRVRSATGTFWAWMEAVRVRLATRARRAAGEVAAPLAQPALLANLLRVRSFILRCRTNLGSENSMDVSQKAREYSVDIQEARTTVSAKLKKHRQVSL